MLCKKCIEIYNLRNLVNEGEKCELCNNIWDKLKLNISSKRVAIRISGFDDRKYLFNPKSTLSTAIKEQLVKEYNLTIDSVDPDLYIDINPQGVQLKNAELFIFGRYWKLKNNISQKRWRDRRFTSIEEIIGEELVKKYKAKHYYIHASGREDIDAFNIAGRPFVAELIEPEIYEVKPGIINNDKIVALIYGRVRRRFRKLVSNSHFDKGYLCYHDELNNEEIQKLNSISYLKISQYTPIRVEKRRALKTRYRLIYKIRAFNLYSYIYSEAGAYIKEFFHGDNGRTNPSISSILGRMIKCKTLIVSRIYDRFLDISFKRYSIPSFH